MIELTPEHRLWLSALLLVLSERDQKFIKIKHRSGDRDRRTKQHIAEGAQLFVESDDFNTMCKVFDFNADELRSKTPQEAYDAYRRVIDNNIEIEDNDGI